MDQDPPEWNKITLWLPQGKWENEDVAEQLGKQYIDGFKLSVIALTSIYRLTKSIYRTSDLTGVTRGTVWNRLKKQGENTRLGNGEFWTPDQDDLLKRLYPQVANGKCLAKYVAKALHRSINSIHQRAKRLGIGRSREDRTITNIPEYTQGKFFWPWLLSPHPKGMLGKKHSQETKDRISAFNSGKVIPIEQIQRSLKTRLQKYGSLAPIVSHGRSWKAAWREIGGKRCFFRSRWEANYARYLEFLKIHGNITEWEHEPFTFWFEGVKRGCVSYLPDFRVTNSNGSQEYHEVKGWMDPRSITKIQRMAKYFPDTKLVIIGKDWFKRNRKNLQGLVPGWETSKF